jgi:hypothetical protein
MIWREPDEDAWQSAGNYMQKMIQPMSRDTWSEHEATDDEDVDIDASPERLIGRKRAKNDADQSGSSDFHRKPRTKRSCGTETGAENDRQLETVAFTLTEPASDQEETEPGMTDEQRGEPTGLDFSTDHDDD